MHYNLVAGTFDATGVGGTNFIGEATVSAGDAYTVMGLPAGTPVTITAKLQVVGATGTGCGPSSASGRVTASLTSGAATQQVTANSTPGGGGCVLNVAVNTTVVISIPCLAGQPFTMVTLVEAAARANTSTLSGSLLFDNLPAGASVVSCQGFTQVPTPARGSSWGRVKQIYR